MNIPPERRGMGAVAAVVALIVGSAPALMGRPREVGVTLQHNF